MNLTAKHLELIEMLADPADQRTKDEKSAAAGFTPKRVYHLVKDADFAAELDRRTTQLVRGHRSRVFEALLRACDNGDVQAIRTYLQATGDIGTGGVNVVTNVSQTNGKDLADRISEALEGRAEVGARAALKDRQ